MEVRVTKCQNGHYYDANKYDACPHCGAAEFTLQDIKREPEQKKGWFKKKKVEPMPETSKQPESSFRSASVNLIVVEDVETQGALHAEEFSSSDVTEGLFETAKEETPVMVPNEEPQESSLLNQVQQVTGDNDGRTMGFFSTSQSTTSVPAGIGEPVVGWITCVKGNQLGKSYHLVSGRNSVGRFDSNDIVLTDENSVSREKHAWIIYEPRKRKFYVQPGEGSGLTYVNDENIFVATEICSGDMVEFGETKFIFTPLCGEHFTWEDYIG